VTRDEGAGGSTSPAHDAGVGDGTHDTRTHILDTALEVFAISGYRAASIRDIASRAGISHPTLLYHFPSKAHLLMAVLHRREDVDNQGRDFAALPPRDMLRQLLVSARINSGARGVVELFANLSTEASDPEHPAHEYFVDRYARLRTALEGSFAALARKGELAVEVPPSVAAAQVIALMDGLQVQWLLDADSIDMEEALHAFLRTLVRDL